LQNSSQTQEVLFEILLLHAQPRRWDARADQHGRHFLGRVDGARILLLGFTFKQNCPDIRNTKVFELYNELKAFGHEVTIYDPLALRPEAKHEYGIDLAPELPKGPFDAVVLAVRHDTFASLGEARLRELLVRDGLLYDIKEVLPVPSSDARI